MAKKVYVGMSGGVDSSLTAALLARQGYAVTGVYMKNWSKDLPGFSCPWKEDYQDAKRVAVQLDIPFKMYDFENDYRHKVVDYMINEYKAGRTPNPDIMCNQEIKFKLFLETAIEDGADFVATGHYAKTNGGRLYKAKDADKDQTYFLYRVESAALKRTIFPLEDLTKSEVREMAKKLRLVTARKKESMGICFVGKVGIKDFLINELGPQKPGKIVNQVGEVIGEHDGAIYYTIGQRHGLDVGGGLPYYVTGKNMSKNEVYVTTNLDDKKLWTDQIKLSDLHWINDQLNFAKSYQVRTRHRAPLVKAHLEKNGADLIVKLKDETRAATAGQSVVIYDKDLVLGGGVIV